ncbi:thioredoxin family protein [Marinilabilia rubra]|uniref:Thioredoxin n=1 Tax=Marinilabilia rubra TaxID=2162893 RepID=A0A2U2BA10_9BACT|nr:thioredoxin family protein [Marinilabilia rubra]PWD99909.1 thioredoxin [Marinilabilia rubra]
MKNIQSTDHFLEVTRNNGAALVYFSHDQCNVCKVLKPKVQAMMDENFPLMPMFYCNTVEQPEVSAQNRIFAVPSVLVFFDGRETFRFSRNVGLSELKNAIERPYSLMF